MASEETIETSVIVEVDQVTRESLQHIMWSFIGKAFKTFLLMGIAIERRDKANHCIDLTCIQENLSESQSRC